MGLATYPARPNGSWCGAGRVTDGGGSDPLWSHLVSWQDLLVPVPVDAGVPGLDLTEGWPDRWMVTWRTGRERVYP